MSTLAAVILLYIPEETLAFGALKQIFALYGLNEWYGNGLLGLQKYVFTIFETLVQESLPRLHTHLERILGTGMGVDHYTGLFVTNWFLELYFESVPWSLMLQIWDTLLWLGTPAVYRIGLSLLASLESELLGKTDLSQLVKQLKGTMNVEIDHKKLLKRAFNYDITVDTIEKIKSRLDGQS